MTTPIKGKNSKIVDPYKGLTRDKFRKELPGIDDSPKISQKQKDRLFYTWQYERSIMTEKQFKNKYKGL